MAAFLRLLSLFILSKITTGFLFTRQVCYQHIGCFSNARPFRNAKGYLPEPPDHIQTNFLLYTRQNTTHAKSLDPYNNATVTGSHFDSAKNTKVIIHGYRDSGHSHWMQQMVQVFLNTEDVNVIAVDWSLGADNINYIKSAANTRVVGATTAKLLEQLHHTTGLSYSRVHLIGHSLGSHIAGYAGRRVHGIGRITGLDPAGPLFENFDAQVRLDPTDASFVDVIHSDSDSLSKLGFGLDKALGHADFYPNGGEKQPGCSQEDVNHWFFLIALQIEQFTDTVACSHMRAIALFTESIPTSGCSFTAYPCQSKADYDAGRCHSCDQGCSEMGYHADKYSAHGKFYLSTTGSPPFCQ
ncbi:inactive pancreatic lipase-related protein 1-like [Mizuhopecten yessoensis]|uniref:Inactive pancreatic lipase-related protein 1 n=1 Tax=Mizuhopecten yessoensis TaxID=6573 RepID=A0A210Q4J1_MIZYE|nr:inactive pancreatic lipase-related protein 1-like [Mizuhopecten yessoensis]OWF43647.1 Inactive pancreatic lipase-related protein 1 [Mizuhopecten yessoensis]